MMLLLLLVVLGLDVRDVVVTASKRSFPRGNVVETY